ncbi:hypothetical protein [Bradyrhizobium sp. 62]|uniref:hypothetical protein n=1 Tax=Bradyrhizobium sp. 62 TaxID=1043588 RepID=UPI001FF81258|nr:hypothetical protein [Bradyrhizobium sp. 62]MCK1364138.1 hypothetical protein [Bradyrhizobium sp. 62]
MGKKSHSVEEHWIWNCWRIAGYLFAALNVVLFVSLLTRGLDLTDEGFYLNWIKNPWEYSFFLTATGFFFHPLALMFPDNIVAWRLVAGVIVLGFGFAFGCSISAYACRWLPEKPKVSVSAGLFLSIAALSFYSCWLPSPGYNLLNFAGCLSFTSGLLFSAGGHVDAHRRRIVSSAAMISFGAIAIWMARPSTAFPMALFALIFLVVHRQREVFWSLIWAAVSTLIVSAAIVMVIGGTFQGMVDRYRLGFELIGLLRPPFLLSVKDQFRGTFSHFEWAFFLVGGAIVVAIVQLGCLNRLHRALHLVVASALIAIGICIGAKIVADDGGRSVARLWPLAAVIALLVAYLCQARVTVLAVTLLVMSVLVWQSVSSVLTMVIFATLMLGIIGRSVDSCRARACWTALLLCWVPIAFGFGSGNSIELMSGLASVFWVAAVMLMVVTLFPSVHGRLVEWIGVGFVCATFAAMIGAASRPYRLTHPLWQQTECMVIGRSSLPICLDPASVSYLQRIKKAALESGFIKSTPIIDLTGTAPTTIFFLEGLPIGSAWLLGGYPNSEEFTRRALETVPREDLNRSWVLSAPKGHRPIPAMVMSSMGLNFPSDYEEVVQSHTEYENEIHILWRPKPK